MGNVVVDKAADEGVVLFETLGGCVGLRKADKGVPWLVRFIISARFWVEGDESTVRSCFLWGIAVTS